MTYNPLPINDLRPGTPATFWGYPGANHNSLYASTICQIGGSGYLNSVSTTSTGYSSWPNLAFRMAKNLDNNVVRVKVRAWVTGATTGTVKVVVDGTDSTEVTTSSTTAEWLTCNVTPTTTGSSERSVDVYIKTGSASYSMKIDSVNAYIVGAAPAAGVLDSEFIGFDASASAASADPIATEYVQRLGDGPIRIAKDRRLALACVVDNGVTPRADMQSTSTSFTVAYVGRVYLPDTKKRNYKIQVYQGPATVNPESRITIGQHVETLTGPGWKSATVALAGSSKQTAWVDFQVEFRRISGSYPAGIGTILIRRES